MSKDGEKKLHIEKSDRADIYVFEHYLAADSSETILPRSLEKENSDLLFYPSEQTVEITNKCFLDSSSLSFEARKGLMFSGRSDPEIQDVEVIVKIKGTDRVVSTEISPTGAYSLGPLYDNEEYEISMMKEGYIFVEDPTQTGLFSAKILSFLSVTIRDASEAPVSNVLVSVSSGKNYREVVYTDSEGRVKFVDLYSGKYYLTLLLKEYKFSPNKLTVEIKEGERIEKTVEATKVAFSVFGKVEFASGDPISEVVIQAHPINSDSNIEEALTHENGEYRLRGLIPGQQYEIYIINKDSSKMIERTVPHSLKLSII